jgi:hypothetical protein
MLPPLYPQTLYLHMDILQRASEVGMMGAVIPGRKIPEIARPLNERAEHKRAPCWAVAFSVARETARGARHLFPAGSERLSLWKGTPMKCTHLHIWLCFHSTDRKHTTQNAVREDVLGVGHAKEVEA